MSSPSVDLPWLFLGARLVFDPAAAAFLASTALVWLLAGWHALCALEGSPQRTRFLGFFMLTMVANLLVTVSGDAVTFLLGYSVMGIAAYPLVVHHGNTVAIRVGRSYLLVMIAGEGALLAAILLTGSTPDLNLLPLTFTTWTAAALVVVGFGVKAGIPGLHAWMPATYSVAPTAAASALAGATVGTGVLGLLRFGVFGPDSPIPPVALVVGGAGGAVFGVVRGLMRLEPERILAYSSVSQMGIAIAALGAGAAPHSGGALSSGTFEPSGSVGLALSAFIAHHALAKASLFLGVGVLRSGEASSDTRVRRTRLALLAVPAMALAGLPLTSGALAKGALTYGLPGAGIQTFFLASAAGSTALMLHFLAAAAHTHPRVRTTGHSAPREAPWLISVAAVVLGVWLWPAFHDFAVHALEPAVLLHGLWPPALGAGLWGALYVVGWKPSRRPSFTDRLAHRAGVRWDSWLSRRQEGRPEFRHLPARARRQVRRAALVFEGSVEKLDQRVGTWTLTGVLFLTLVLTLRVLF